MAAGKRRQATRRDHGFPQTANHPKTSSMKGHGTSSETAVATPCVIASPCDIATSTRQGHGDAEEASIATVENLICGYIRDEGDDLSMRQIGILIRIAQSPIEITPLANELRLSLSTVSRSIDTLVRLKLARRHRRGRHVSVNATPLGEAKVGRLVAKAMASR